jgi:molybdopterin converting factor small subunit
MKVKIKVFPIAGLCDQSMALDLDPEEGGMSGLIMCLRERLGKNPLEIENIMFVHNGRLISRLEDAVLLDGDKLWMMPQVSGG